MPSLKKQKGKQPLKIYKVEKNGIPITELFCENVCNNKCLMAKKEKLQILKIRNVNKKNEQIPACYLNYQINKITEKSVSPYLSDTECLIEIKLTNGENTSDVTGILDTGAQVSCISLVMLEKLFGKDSCKLKQSDRKLLGANEQDLNCLGVITLRCTINKISHLTRFYVLENSENIILGLPAIRLFRIIINVSGYEVEKENKIRAILYDKSINDVRMPPNVFLATPLTKHSVDNFNTANITLTLCGNIDKTNSAIHFEAEVFDCLCLTEDKNLCQECKELGPFDVSTVLERGIVKVEFKPRFIHDLVPKLDYFQIKIMRGPNVRVIGAEPPAFSFNEVDGLDYEKGGFLWEKGVIAHQEIYPIKETVIKNLNIIENSYPEQVCGSCKLKKNVFCNFRNEACQKLLQYKMNTNMEVSEKCSIITQNSFKILRQHEALVFHIEGYTEMIEHLMKYNKLYIESLDEEKSNQELRILTIKNEMDKYCFILMGKITLLNIEMLLAQLANECTAQKIETMHLIDFQTFEISKEFLRRIFRIHIVKLMIYPENLVSNASIKKVVQNGQEVKASLAEEVDFKTQLNVVLNCTETREKMLKLCKVLNISDDHLKPLWSKSSHDVGLFRQREAPFFPIKFSFPIKPEMEGKPPISIKTAFVSNRLLGPAKEMLDALEQANIIVRGYSKFNARTHFLLKPPKELTIKEWVEQGYGNVEDFVAGTLNKKGALTVRMVHHFLDLNERTINSPIYQPSTSEQLRKISPKIKFLSIIDVTACFFSLMIDKKSSELTGFDVGIQQYQRYKYLRVPMGAGISKTLQDAALLHTISDLGNYLIYSDNILVISETKEKHYEHLQSILMRLQLHGFKCKLSKASFFITNMVRLYGHIVDLANGTLRPESDKLEALRSKPVPRTRKELKSFLGGLQFFGQLLPLAGDQLASLHQATRGKEFIWTTKHQKAYEEIILLLSKEGLIFVYRGDDDRPYRVSIDTSEFHTSYIVFQLDDNQENRPILYGMKTWNEAFANHIPEYRELLGIVHTLAALQPEYEHKKHPLIVYTDNLPLCLMNIAARFSRKIARIKLFIESLNWVILHWAPGSSELIALADYFSRQREDKPTKVRQPNQEDRGLCREISDKIDTSKIYSGPLSSFLIDSIIELPEEEFRQIKDKTVTLNSNNELVYIAVNSERIENKELTTNSINIITRSKSSAKKEEILESPLITVTNNSGSTFDKERKRIKSPINSTTNEANNMSRTNNEFMNSKKVIISDPIEETQIVDILPTDRLGKKTELNKIPVKITSPEADSLMIDKLPFNEQSSSVGVNQHLNNGVFRKVGDLLEGRPVTLTRNDIQISNHFSEGKEERCIDLLDHPSLISARNSNIIPEPQQTKMLGNGSITRWYNNFISRAKYLNKEKLREALEMDPYWQKILDICIKQNKYLIGEKTYLIYGGILICKEKIRGNANVYKVCLPGSLGYDTVLMAHRQLLHIHGKKLVNSLSVHFEIKDLEKLVSHICRECFVCGLNQPQAAGGKRQPLPKGPMMVRKKCSLWFVDEVQLVNKNTGRELAGYSKLLVAIDGFTHFMIIEPLSEQLTGEIFLKFIQERIHQVFGPCDALVTDNDSKLSSELVQAACGYLGIMKLESLPYSPRANLAELANKLLLTGLRNETLSLYMNPKYFHILLHNIVYLINSLVFTDSKFISPYLLMFAQYPKQDILQIYTPGAEEFLDKNVYMKHLLLINDVFTKIRLSMIDKRKYPNQTGKNKNYWDSMGPGDIVTIRNPERFVEKINWKLRPLYKSKFLIVKRTDSSAFLRPLENIYLKNFKAKKHESNISPDFVYKAEVTLLKKISHMTLLHSNKVKDYYAHFVDNNRTPQPYYMIQNEDEPTGLLRTWDQMYTNEPEILSELKEAEQIMCKNSSVRSIKPCLKDNYRTKMITDIVNAFKRIQNNSIGIIKVNKRVSFKPEVCVRSLIKPEIIFLCKKPKYVDIQYEPKPTLRTIVSGGKTYFCSCKSCKKQLNFCLNNPCENCYGVGAASKD